jgi:exosortase
VKTTLIEPERPTNRELLLLAVFIAASIPPYWTALRELVLLVWNDAGYSHIMIVPLVSAWFLWNCRGDLKPVAGDRASRIAAALAIGLGVAGFASGWVLSVRGSTWYLAVWILSLLCMWIGGFALTFGSHGLRSAAFPLAFLIFLVPPPGPLLQSVIGKLQHASVELTYWGFRLTNTPVYREGITFTLPNLNIEVARECSSIRSSISLLLTTIIAVHLFLKSKLNKVLLIALVVPIAVFKNAMRIVILSLLAIYVDRSFIDGKLHHRGGFVFFLLALSLVFGLMSLLRRFEERHRTVQSQSHFGASGG